MNSTVNDEVLLPLYCPECRDLVEAVADAESLICMDCGWKFDEKVAAKFLSRAAEMETPAATIQRCKV